MNKYGNEKNFFNGKQKYLLFSGRIKTLEDIIPGDLLMGPDSTPREVLGKDKKYGDLFRVKQKIGVDYIAPPDQELYLRVEQDDKKEHPGDTLEDYRHNTFLVPLHMKISEYLSSPAAIKIDTRGYRTWIKLPIKSQPVEAYEVGFWLGREKIEKDKEMQIFNLLDEIEIPDLYLYNGKDPRLRLLAGIIDATGKLRKIFYRVEIFHHKLAEQVVFLANSLGYKVVLGKNVRNRAKYRFMPESPKKRPEENPHRIYISGYIRDIPTKIAGIEKRRPKEKQTIHQPMHNQFISEIKIKYAAKADYYQLRLNRDGMCLLDDCTIVHV